MVPLVKKWSFLFSKLLQMQHSVRDLWAIFSFSCSFWQKLFQMIGWCSWDWRPPLEILNPPLTLYYDLMMLFDSRGMLPRHRLLHFKNYSINDSFQIHIVFYFTAMHESPSKHPQKQSQQVDLFIRWMLRTTGIDVQEEQASDKKDGFNLIFLSSQHVAIS